MKYLLITLAFCAGIGLGFYAGHYRRIHKPPISAVQILPEDKHLVNLTTSLSMRPLKLSNDQLLVSVQVVFSADEWFKQRFASLPVKLIRCEYTLTDADDYPLESFTVGEGYSSTRVYADSKAIFESGVITLDKLSYERATSVKTSYNSPE